MLSPRPRRSLAASALLLALLALARGCSGSDSSPATAAGAAGASSAGRGGAGHAGSGGYKAAGHAGLSAAGAAGEESAGTDAGADAGGVSGNAGAGPVDCGPFAPPAAVPAGWVEYKDWSCQCRLYRPPSADSMPPPIQWEACPALVDPTLSCQRMKTDWTDTAKFPPLAGFPQVWPVPGSSKVLLQFSRGSFTDFPDARYHLVAEADGPVLNALLQVNPNTGGCFLFSQGLRDHKYLWRLLGDTWDEPGFGSVEGILAADVGDLSPKVLLKQTPLPHLNSDWDLSGTWLVQNQIGVRVRPWDHPDQFTQVFAAGQDPDGMDFSSFVPLGPDVLLNIGQGPYHGVLAWSQDKGLRPLQRWVGDYTRGAGNLGSDGKDLVWTYGEGKQPSDDEFPATSVYTAPYATDMATVEATKRRVRSDVTRPGDSDYQYVVGCGYAARRYYLDGQTSNLLVVRLSDGRAWKILGKPQGSPTVYWSNPLAISCEHVYTSLSVGGETPIIARLPLASLGPGLPAD